MTINPKPGSPSKFKKTKVIIPFLWSMFTLPLFLWGQTYQGYLLITLGKDTVGIEKFTINGNEVQSEAVRRVNQISKHSANISYREDGSIQKMETYDYNIADSLIGRSLIRSVGDSLFGEWETNGRKNSWTAEGRPHL